MSQPEAQHDLLLGASCITPFGGDGSLNESALRRQLNRFVDAGLAVWVASSGTAEGNVLTDDEIDRIVGDRSLGDRRPSAGLPRWVGTPLGGRSARLRTPDARSWNDAVQVGPPTPDTATCRRSRSCVC